MNGEYVFSSTPNGIPGLFPKQFKDYPGGVESYDWISSPMTTRYSQVWWKPLGPTSLPKTMVDKYKNKKVAIVGWEIDQVWYDSNNVEHSVPISASYNHHYVAQLAGGTTKYNKIKLTGENDPRLPELRKHSHGIVNMQQYHYIAELGDNGSNRFVSSGNGGEYRKTFHGFPPGYAVVVESPTTLNINAMQIDTWNRDKMNISETMPSKFVSGPVPKASLAPIDGEYSGLLECPMTTRISKDIKGAYVLQSNSPGCIEEPIVSFEECYTAAATTLNTGNAKQIFQNSTGASSTKPTGCSVTRSNTSKSSFPLLSVYFNTLTTSKTSCASNPNYLIGTASVESVGTTIQISLNKTTDLATITLTGPKEVWFGVGFNAKAMAGKLKCIFKLRIYIIVSL